MAMEEQTESVAHPHEAMVVENGTLAFVVSSPVVQRETDLTFPFAPTWHLAPQVSSESTHALTSLSAPDLSSVGVGLWAASVWILGGL